jgi:hypothetical protein
MSRRTTETLGKSFGVTVRAARTDFGAAANWIPRRIRPFNFGIIAYVKSFMSLLFCQKE